MEAEFERYRKVVERKRIELFPLPADLSHSSRQMQTGLHYMGALVLTGRQLPALLHAALHPLSPDPSWAYPSPLAHSPCLVVPGHLKASTSRLRSKSFPFLFLLFG